jgi:hypothetical protein
MNGKTDKLTVFSFLFKHKHKWQTRATNRWQIPTYQVCTKCGEARKWDGGPQGYWVQSERKPEFDNQFDHKNRYIFK